MGVFLSVHRIKDSSKQFMRMTFGISLDTLRGCLTILISQYMLAENSKGPEVSITNKTLIILICNVFNSKGTDGKLLLQIVISRNCPSVG